MYLLPDGSDHQIAITTKETKEKCIEFALTEYCFEFEPGVINFDPDKPTSNCEVLEKLVVGDYGFKRARVWDNNLRQVAVRLTFKLSTYIIVVL